MVRLEELRCVFLCAGLDQYGRLTEPMGVRMAEFPLSPMFAKMLLESGNFGCSKEIVTIAAMMQIQNIFVFPSDQKKAAVSVLFLHLRSAAPSVAFSDKTAQTNLHKLHKHSFTVFRVMIMMMVVWCGYRDAFKTWDVLSIIREGCICASLLPLQKSHN